MGACYVGQEGRSGLCFPFDHNVDTDLPDYITVGTLQSYFRLSARLGWLGPLLRVSPWNCC
jgi:hypothetical protein